ncbi:MAG: hypothetical protein OEY62_10630 [Acidimicrobiia bacterium]|nr:hypothetical protein [Acidimicrobiia bacterium]
MATDRVAQLHTALAEVEAVKRRALEGLAWTSVSDRCLADFNRRLSASITAGPPVDVSRLATVAGARHAGAAVFGGKAEASQRGWCFSVEGEPVTCHLDEVFTVTVPGYRAFGFDLEPNLFESLAGDSLEQASTVQRRILAARAELDGVAGRIEQSLLSLGLEEAGLRGELDRLEKAEGAGRERIWEGTALKAVRGFMRGPIQPSLARFLGLQDEV